MCDRMPSAIIYFVLIMLKQEERNEKDIVSRKSKKGGEEDEEIQCWKTCVYEFERYGELVHVISCDGASRMPSTNEEKKETAIMNDVDWQILYTLGLLLLLQSWLPASPTFHHQPNYSYVIFLWRRKKTQRHLISRASVIHLSFWCEKKPYVFYWKIPKLILAVVMIIFWLKGWRFIREMTSVCS